MDFLSGPLKNSRADAVHPAPSPDPLSPPGIIVSPKMSGVLPSHGMARPRTTARPKRPGTRVEPPPSASLPFHLSFLHEAALRPQDGRAGAGSDRLVEARSQDVASASRPDAATQAILAQQIDETSYYRLAAEKLGIPFTTDLPPDAFEPAGSAIRLDQLHALDWLLARPFARLPGLTHHPNTRLVSAPRGAALDRLAARLQREPDLKRRLCLTTPTALANAHRERARRRAIGEQVFRLRDRYPHLSAHFRPGLRQAAFALCAVAIAFIGALIQPNLAITFNFFTIMLFLTLAFLRLMAWWELPLLNRTEAQQAEELETAGASMRVWPSYTVMVPLYHEAEVVPDLLRALSRLDYPRAHLSIQLLVEEDDEATRRAIKAAAPPPPFEMVLIPAEGPRTKPKALNYALSFVSSDLVVIFDAEDRPHPNQLREAAIRMHQGGPELGCLQGRLAIDNAEAGFLSRNFAIEYAALFDGLLPFLAEERLPVPLGGTSNHFRTSVLKRIGGWDPYNVTEDADLGLRLSRLGFRIKVLLSDTWEEAPESYETWVKQRTRWFKGWMQTWLVHMRRPLTLWRQLGRSGFVAFQILIAGMLISALIHPIFIVTFATTFATIALKTSANTPLFWYLAIANGINLLIGYLGAMLLAHRAAKKRYGYRFHDMITLPLYWLMMTPAAWRALFQLMHKPHHWEKTTHGVTDHRPPLTDAPEISQTEESRTDSTQSREGLSHGRKQMRSQTESILSESIQSEKSLSAHEVPMRRDPSAPKGTVHSITVASECLKSNMLGDPTEREVQVYIPHGHDGADLPLLVDIVGYTAGGPVHTNWKNFGENVPERLDRLIASGALKPVAVAFPDCFTRLGGNQYINSAAMGPWEDFLIDEMLPAIESRFGCGGEGRRGIFGKSSGGYGSIVHAMLHADVWSAAACLSGDMAFELCYLPDMPSALRALARKDHSIETFLKDFEAGVKFDGKDIHVLMSLAMAATYDPDPNAFCGIRLPVDMHDCSLVPERWENWLKWDPVVMVDRPEVIDNLKSLKGLWLECGTMDQYNLLYGARRLHTKLSVAQVHHSYREFPDTHSSIDYRMDDCLPFLVNCLTAS